MSFKLKPPLGTPLNKHHPISKGLICSVLMNDPGTTSEYNYLKIFDSSVYNWQLTVNSGIFWKYGDLRFYYETPLVFPDMRSLFGTEASCFAELKADFDPPVNANLNGPLSFGYGGDLHYPYTDGSLYLDTFRNDRLYLGKGVVDDLTQWHTFAITQKPGANNWILYQNGLVGGIAAGEPAVTIPAAPNIGKGGGKSFYGHYRNFFLWNRALAHEEILQMHLDPYAMFKQTYPIEISSVYVPAPIGWTGKICGVTNPSKICGIAVADIAKVCGI